MNEKKNKLYVSIWPHHEYNNFLDIVNFDTKYLYFSGKCFFFFKLKFSYVFLIVITIWQLYHIRSCIISVTFVLHSIILRTYCIWAHVGIYSTRTDKLQYVFNYCALAPYVKCISRCTRSYNGNVPVCTRSYKVIPTL